MTSKLANRAGPTSAAERAINCQRSSPWGSRPCSSRQCSRCLCAFSIITTAASTIAPMAMAMPPNDSKLAEIPWACITMKAARIPKGRVMTATNAERRCHRNSRHTSATTRNSSPSLWVRLRTASWISSERSYTATTSTPSGKLDCNACSRALTFRMAPKASLPVRRTITPPATSP